jgi:hypothetical protein
VTFADPTTNMGQGILAVLTRGADLLTFRATTAEMDGNSCSIRPSHRGRG